MKSYDPGAWPLILLISPLVSYYAWSVGLASVLLSFSAMVVLLGAAVCATGRPSEWKKHAPHLVITGLIQFVLIIPVSGLVAEQEALWMVGGESSGSIAAVLIRDHMPSAAHAWWMQAK
tara:strand:+ start:133 stop:489 length:357 start_codon:yes stop_codon:yes gene_type:complete